MNNFTDLLWPLYSQQYNPIRLKFDHMHFSYSESHDLKWFWSYSQSRWLQGIRIRIHFCPVADENIVNIDQRCVRTHSSDASPPHILFHLISFMLCFWQATQVSSLMAPILTFVLLYSHQCILVNSLLHACLQLERLRLDGATGPQTAEDYDRLALQSPNSSLIWLRYMAFHLESTEIDKARSVAERALKTISFRFYFWQLFIGLIS